MVDPSEESAMDLDGLKALFAAMPHAQALWVALFFLVSVIGGNYVFIRHNQKHGLPAWSGWNPFSAMQRFDRSDWIWLCCVLAAALICLIMAGSVA